MSGVIPALVLLLAVLGLLLRDFLKLPFSPWQIMCAGALVVLLLGQISPAEALGSIDWGVMLFLYGMFTLALFLQESWYLEHLGYKVLRRFNSPFMILLAAVFAIGIGSALLLNDTVAIIGVPLCLLLSQKSGMKSAPLIVALALAVTIGGVASPIGNPQNFIIASQPQMQNPFVTFAIYLAVPTILSLLALTALLWLYFPALHALRPILHDVSIRSREYDAARRGLQAVLVLSFLRLLSSIVPEIPAFPLWWIAAGGAAAALLLSGKWRNLLRVDFETLAFFAGMFILMDCAWLSGVFQEFLPLQGEIAKPLPLMAASLILPQALSNVPFVVLYLKAMGGNASVLPLILLAAGSTLAGALSLLGAASNVIILQSVEKRGEKFPMKEFMLLGAISTAISIALIFGWLWLLQLL